MKPIRILALAALAAIALLAASAAGQSLQRPEVEVSAPDLDSALRQAVSCYLATLFPTNPSPEQRLLQAEILSQAELYARERRISREARRCPGSVAVDARAILDRIGRSGIVLGDFASQEMQFAGVDARDWPAAGFFAGYGFRVRRLGEEEERNWRSASSGNSEEWCAASLRPRQVLVSAETRSGRLHVSAYSRLGRMFAEIQAPLDGEEALCSFYRISSQELLSFRLLEEVIRQTLKWQTAAEHRLVVHGLSAEQSAFLRSLLAEWKRDGVLLWQGRPAEDEARFLVEVACRKDVDLCLRLGERLPAALSWWQRLRCAQEQESIAATVETAPSAAWAAALLLAAVAALPAFFLIRFLRSRRIQAKSAPAAGGAEHRRPQEKLLRPSSPLPRRFPDETLPPSGHSGATVETPPPSGHSRATVKIDEASLEEGGELNVSGGSIGCGCSGNGSAHVGIGSLKVSGKGSKANIAGGSIEREPR